MVLVVENINKCVCEEDSKTLMQYLKSSSLNLSAPPHDEEEHLYLRLLKKRLNNADNHSLWYDDIVNVLKEVDSESEQVKTLTDILVQINLTIVNKDITGFCQSLSSITTIEKSYKDIYFQMFSKAFKKKSGNVCPWTVCHTDAGNTFYIDIESYSYSWSTPKDFVPYSRYISKKDVHNIIEKINKHHIYKFKEMEAENCIIKIQARCRGYLLRNTLRNKLNYFKQYIEDIIKIQSWWRKVRMMKKYGNIIKMKALETRLRVQRKENPWAWYKAQVRSFYIFIIVTI